MKPTQILIVDDEPLIRQSLSGVLEDEGYQTQCVESGEECLELLRRTIDDAFSDFDVMVLPTRRHTPRTVDASIKREESDKPRNPEQENTQAFDAYGIPAISVPCGFTAAGLPVGLMIAGPRFSESRVLALARAYEQATEWHKRRPALTPDMPVPKLAVTDDSDEPLPPGEKAAR